MSNLEDKISSGANQKTGGGGGDKAQCLLYKHLTYKSGEPKYRLLEKDSIGPYLVVVERGGSTFRWRRVMKVGGDFLMEADGGD